MTAPAAGRPQPLLSRAGLIGAVAVAVQLVVGLGVVPATLGDQIKTTADLVITAVFAVITVVGLFVHAKSSAKVVTPLAAPQDNAGRALVPVGSAPATLDAAATLAAMDAIYPGVRDAGSALTTAASEPAGHRPMPAHAAEPDGA